MDSPVETRPPSAFHDLLGFEVIERAEGRIVGTLDIAARHLNYAGIVHGGVYSTMIDAACGGAGLYCPFPGRIRRSVTLSLTVQFTSAAKAGRMTVVGTLQNAGRRIYTSTAEIRDDDGVLLAHGSGTFQYRRGSESENGVAITE